jgi:hypothetical protein
VQRRNAVLVGHVDRGAVLVDQLDDARRISAFGRHHMARFLAVWPLRAPTAVQKVVDAAALRHQPRNLGCPSVEVAYSAD